MVKRRRVVHLIVPPYTPPMVPHLGMPVLAGDLLTRGFEVRQTDLNIRFHDDMLHFPPLLLGIVEHLEEEFHRLDRQPCIDWNDATRYLVALDRLARARNLWRRRPEIAARCRGASSSAEALPFGYAPQQDAFELVNVGLSLLGAHRMVLGEPTSPATLEPAGKAEHLLRGFFQRHIPADRSSPPQMIGISVLYGSQVGCALLLARYLRESFPGVPIVAGGAFARDLARIVGSEASKNRFDAMVTGEGEERLAHLAATLECKDGNRGPLVLEGIASRGRLPAPVFSGQELPLYWSHPLTLPLQFSRGCYWQRCAFCSYRACYSGPYRLTAPQRASKIVKQLQTRYGCTRFWLVDDCLSPVFLSRFADSLISERTSARWSASVRFEPAFDTALLGKLAVAGCHRLTFGMESMSQRLLDYIRKGTHVDHYLPILRGCRKANIEVHLNWIAGLPGETPEELNQTVAFLTEHSDLYSYQFGHVFRLEPDSPFALESDTFGLPAKVVPEPFHSDTERARLRALIRSISRPEPGDGVNPRPELNVGDALGWSPRTVKQKVGFDVSRLRRLGEGEPAVHRLDREEWLVLDPWSGQSAQMPEAALAWVEAELSEAGSAEADELLALLRARGLLTAKEGVD